MESTPAYKVPPTRHAVRTDLPLYRSHKLVRAAKITSCVPASGSGNFTLALALLEPEAFTTTNVTQDWLDKRVPPGQTPVGGYFVVYDDGYESWSPADKFEQGNSLLDAADLAQLAQQQVHGTHPDGTLNQHDQGAVVLAVSTEDAPKGAPYKKVLRIDFGTPVSWLGMPPQQAVEFAAAILKRARECGAVVTLHL